MPRQFPWHFAIFAFFAAKNSGSLTAADCSAVLAQCLGGGEDGVADAVLAAAERLAGVDALELAADRRAAEFPYTVADPFIPMTRKTYCGNLLWQSGLTLLAPPGTIRGRAPRRGVRARHAA